MIKLSLLIVLALMGALPSASAKNELVMSPIQDGLKTMRTQRKLDEGVRLYFGDQKTPQVLQQFGNFVANRKTDGFAKSEGDTCAWAFMSAIKALQERARAVGANAVINIHSYYKEQEVSSASQYECHKGTAIARAALRGDLVKLADN